MRSSSVVAPASTGPSFAAWGGASPDEGGCAHDTRKSDARHSSAVRLLLSRAIARPVRASMSRSCRSKWSESERGRFVERREQRIPVAGAEQLFGDAVL